MSPRAASPDMRQRILEAALRVIGDRGVGGLTHRLVAREAGVSLGSLTYHFASQTELVRESLLLFVREETERIRAVADSVAPEIESLGEAAELAQRAIASVALGRAELGAFEVYLQAARDPELQAAVAGCLSAYDQVVSVILTRLGVPEPESLAPEVVAYVMGSQLRRLAGGDAAGPSLARGLQILLGTASTADAPEAARRGRRTPRPRRPG